MSITCSFNPFVESILIGCKVSLQKTHCIKADNICESSDFLFGSSVNIIIASCRYFYCRINRLSSTFKYKDLSVAVHTEMGASVCLL